MNRRAKHRFFLTLTLLCAATIACDGGNGAFAVETTQSVRPLVAGALPQAAASRIAGDEKQTRFVLDLDRKIDVRAFSVADPYRVVVDLPQVKFDLTSGAGEAGRGLIRSFRYGLVMPGASRIVFDLAGPAKLANLSVLDAANGQPARLVIELVAVDRTAFKPTTLTAVDTNAATLRPSVVADASARSVPSAMPTKSTDGRPVIVLDPGHGGADNGTQAASGENEKALVLDFSRALKARIEQGGKYRVVMTRDDDTFVSLADRVRLARNQAAALFVSVHADALPKGEGDAQGATIYTLSEKASDTEAEKLAEAENKADAIAGISLAEEPAEVADILIDLTRRETQAFSSRFAKTLAGEMKGVARMHKHPLKSAGFKVLKAHDVPSVLIELGYVSNKDDLQHLVSESWRSKTVGSVAQAIDMFFAKRIVSAAPAN